MSLCLFVSCHHCELCELWRLERVCLLLLFAARFFILCLLLVSLSTLLSVCPCGVVCPVAVPLRVFVPLLYVVCAL
jgi:hypothetical protein